MRKTGWGLALLIFVSSLGFAQSEKGASDEVKFYRLDFTVKELEGGKITNTRAYAMTISTDKGGNTGSIRSGDKLPVKTGSSEVSNNQFTYLDVGVNIDCRNARDFSDRLALIVSAEISGAVTGDKSLPAPLIRRTTWNSNVVVPFRKPTTIFSSEAAGSKAQTQLELTATPIR